MRLVGSHGNFDGRVHFLSVAAMAMRSVLIDHARRKQSEKRGGDRARVPLDDVLEIYEERAPDLVALDAALEDLAEVDVRRARIVELRFFGGLTIEEAATVVKSSTATVQRDWRLARLWLLNELSL